MVAAQMSDFIYEQATAWTQIREQFFGHTETPNGPGSFLSATENVRAWLPQIIDEYDIKTMLDVPCGDWNWMQHVDLTALDAYEGWDIEATQIAVNREMFEDHHFAPDELTFNHVNALTIHQLPDADLIWCRDLMIHLPIESSAMLWHKMLVSGARYAALSTCPWVTENVWEIAEGGDDGRRGYWCHAVNLEIDPFFAHAIVDRIDDTEGRQMILVSLNP